LFNTTAIRLGLGVGAFPLLLTYIGLRQTVFAGFDGPASSQVITSMLLLYVGLLPNSISTGLSALFYAFEKAEYPAVTTSISTLLKATLQVIVLVSGLGIIGLAGASIIVNILTLFVLASLAWKYIIPLHRQEWSLNDLKRSSLIRKTMVRESWPLMLNHLLANSFYKVDVFLMDILLGSVPLGLYSIGYKLLDALVVIPSMFTLALFPIISQQAQDDKKKFLRFYHLSAKILAILSLPAAIITTLLANEMVLILGGRQYIPGAVIVLQLIAWSMPFSWFNGLTQYVLIALDEQRFLTRAYIWGFCFSFLANLILMQHFGYEISAILHIFAELVLMIAFLIGIRKNLGNLDWWQIIGTPVRSALISGLIGLVLLRMGRGVALIAFLITYPILLWLLKVLTPEEQHLLFARWQK
jgi:O-antigen/teichoic acid export membrane protein